jgi:translation initiation factor IF-2
MLFYCSLQSSGQSSLKLVSASTWSNCASYLEGTGDVINQINVANQVLIGTNLLSNESYNVSLKDNNADIITSYIIYDTFSNVTSWINSQTGKTLRNLQYQLRPFVQI